MGRLKSEEMILVLAAQVRNTRNATERVRQRNFRQDYFAKPKPEGATEYDIPEGVGGLLGRSGRLALAHPYSSPTITRARNAVNEMAIRKVRLN